MGTYSSKYHLEKIRIMVSAKERNSHALARLFQTYDEDTSEAKTEVSRLLKYLFGFHTMFW